MNLKCPSCRKELELPDGSVSRQKLVCPSCESEFFSANDLTFCYGTKLPSRTAGVNRVACPHCRQHYGIDYKPVDGLVGCRNCLRIFAVPPQNARVLTPVSGEASPHSTETRKLQVIPMGIVPPPVEQPAPAARNSDETISWPAPRKLASEPPPRRLTPEPAAPVIPEPEEPEEKPAKSDESKTQQSMLILRILSNLLWLFFGGLGLALINIFWGVIFCITIIGIPFGLQLFKVASLQLCPFGADVYYAKDKPVGCLCTGFNILWILCGGLWSALGNFIIGALMCCTIIGIPFGLQYFKLGKLLFAPFGLEIRRKDSMRLTYLTAGALLLFYLISSSIYYIGMVASIKSELDELAKIPKLTEPLTRPAPPPTPAPPEEKKKETMLTEEIIDGNGNIFVIQTPAPDAEKHPGVIKLKRKKIPAITKEIIDGDGNIFIVDE